MQQAGATLHRGARASHCRGLSCCGAQAPDAQAQQLSLMGPVAPRHVGSSQTRARTRVPCIGRQILNHCATREAREGPSLNPAFFVSITVAEKSSASLILRSAQPCPQPPDILATFEKPLELAHCLQSLGLWLLGHSLSTLAFARIFGDFCVSCDDPANTQVSEFLDLLTFSDLPLPFPWTIEPHQRPQHLSELLPPPP